MIDFDELLSNVLAAKPEKKQQATDQLKIAADWWVEISNGLVLAKSYEDGSWQVVLVLSSTFYSFTTQGTHPYSIGGGRLKSVNEQTWNDQLGERVEFLFNTLLKMPNVPVPLIQSMRGSEAGLRELM